MSELGKKDLVGEPREQGQATPPAKPQPPAQPQPQGPTPEAPGVTRRNLLLGCAGAVVLLGLGGVSRYAFGNTRLLRPPGGQNEEHFLATCIKCDRCRSVCPRGAILVANLEDGLINARTPRMDFHSRRFVSSVREEELIAEHSAETGESLIATAEGALFDQGMKLVQDASGSSFCDFCNLCIESCPTGALKPFDPRTEWIGEAVLVPSVCIAFEKRGGCRKCVDFCPFNAITLDENMRPVIDPSHCNGCGVCENICPANSYRTYKSAGSRGINVEASTARRPQ